MTTLENQYQALPLETLKLVKISFNDFIYLRRKDIDEICDEAPREFRGVILRLWEQHPRNQASSVHQTQGLYHTLTEISTEFRRQSKKLDFVAKEVVIQHRIRMDNWTESKRSKEEQQAFKESLIAFYQRQHPSDPKLLKCMVLDAFFPREMVIASHIWKHYTHGEGLEEFGLREDDISNPRNGILMCKEIKQAFDIKRLCFLVDRIQTDKIFLKVLDPALLDPATSPLVISGSPLKFCDIDGYPLNHPEGNLPFRRILDFHAKCSYQKAINRRWLVAYSIFEDFFDMPIGSSIPDLHLYQLFDGEDEEEEEG